MNVIVGVAIFVISSFFLGVPISQNPVKIADILQDYNYQVFAQIPDIPEVNSVLADIASKECYVKEEKELVCENLGSLSSEIVEYEKELSFTEGNIKKTIHFVIELFDIRSVYLEDIEVEFNPIRDFTLEQFPYTTNEEHYLVVLFSDSLYFQAQPFGTDNKMILHNNHRLRTSTLRIYYQNMIPDFRFISAESGPQVGSYLLDQIAVGKANSMKLQSFTLAFLLGTCFTLITILLIWIFFRKAGRFRYFGEYYNVAAICNIPIAFLFFILLWLFPSLIYYYIFAFSGFYTVVIYILNTREDFV
jgi:hypothetical protein